MLVRLYAKLKSIFFSLVGFLGSLLRLYTSNGLSPVTLPTPNVTKQNRVFLFVGIFCVLLTKQLWSPRVEEYLQQKVLRKGRRKKHL